jgi:peptidoglycan/xylan/chitin deacetylase (PgdA/CDA1 family)
MRLGLKIDVCTFDGLRLGVPNLLRLLDRHGVRASFFVTLGPDTSGRAILQLFRPGFLAKMRRTRVVRSYGLRTLLSGTLLPPRHLGRGLAQRVREIVQAGHEVAVHGYDHRRWQDRLHSMDAQAVRGEVGQAVALYRDITGMDPRGFGGPGWQCSAASLAALDEFGFSYASDTRDGVPFFPRVNGGSLSTLQLPTTMPTLDEALGIAIPEGSGFPGLVRQHLGAQPWPVLTIHAELEGRGYLPVTDQLLHALRAERVEVVPLETLAEAIRRQWRGRIPVADIALRPIAGRAGTVAMPGALGMP